MELCQVAPIKTVLAPLDFSGQAQITFVPAYTQAKVNGARLILLNNIESLNLDLLKQISQEGYAPPREELEAGMIAEREERLKAEFAEAAGDIQVEVRVTIGRTWEEIIRLVKREAVDLVVMGVSGRTGLGHLIFGSTAEKVFRHSPCPVLSVRGPEVCQLPELD